MLYLFLGFISAALFGIGVATLYGSDALLALPWVDHVFWALIFAGAALAVFQNVPDLWCRLCQRVSGVLTFCGSRSCGETTA